jgi:hypothetical protein
VTWSIKFVTAAGQEIIIRSSSVGSMFNKAGLGRTMNAFVVPTIPAGVLTETRPLVASSGTIAVISFAEAFTKLPKTPSNLTSVTSARFVPRMTTLLPAIPLAGVKPVILGAAINLVVLKPVPAVVVTLIRPLVAAAGTVHVICVEAVTVKLALVPLNLTAVAPLKVAPSIMTLAPGSPADGEKLAITGSRAVTTNELPLAPIPFVVITLIGAVTAPLGTAALI